MTPDLPALIDHIDHFQRRVLQDALNEATVTYWTRRAATFAAVGTERCDEIARACLNHAALLEAEYAGTPLGRW